MRIAVTGASGFIGRHVLAALAEHDVEVTALGRNVSGDLIGRPGVRAVALDMAEVDERTFDRIGRPDALIHFAWGGLPNYRSPHHFETELPQQYKFLSTLVKSGLGCVIAAGTCFEYGMQSGELSESMETRPDNPYGFAKDVLRKQLEYLRRSVPFSMTWGRLFYLYGDGQAPKSLLPQLRRAVEHGEKTFKMSAGEQLRDYSPVTAVAHHFADLAVNKADLGIVNICSGKAISVRRLVEGWVSGNNWDISLELGYYPYPDYEPLAFWGSNKKLTAYTGTIQAVFDRSESRGDSESVLVKEAGMDGPTTIDGSSSAAFGGD